MNFRRSLPEIRCLSQGLPHGDTLPAGRARRSRGNSAAMLVRGTELSAVQGANDSANDYRLHGSGIVGVGLSSLAEGNRGSTVAGGQGVIPGTASDGPIGRAHV